MPQRLKSLLDTGLVDYVAMDIKGCEQNYSKAAGIDIDYEKIKQSIELLKNGNITFEFRTTVVKGIHSVENLTDIAKCIKGVKKYYLQKFKDSGNLLSDTCEAFTDAEMEEFLKAVKAVIPEAELRG